MKPMSPQDAMFLMIERPRMPMHVAGLQLFTPPEGAGRRYVTELVEFARQFQQPEPPFDRRAVFRRGRWYWTPDPQFDLEHHFRHSALPHPGRIRELLTLVSRWHGAMMDRSRPLWEIHFVEGLRDGRFALYGKVHHALFDGVAATRVTLNTLSPDPSRRQMPPPWAVPRPRRQRADIGGAQINPIAALVQSVAENWRVLPGMARGLRELLRGGDEPLEARPYQAPRTMFNTRISASRRFAAQSFPLERIRSVGKAAGATVNDVVLAICAGALRSYLIENDALPDEPLTAMVPVSVRPADGPEGGNQVSLILASLATDVEDPGERLARIVRSTTLAKRKLRQMSRIEQIAYAAASLSPMPLTMLLGPERLRPPFNVVVSNVPGPTQPLYWNGARLDEMYPVSIPVDGVALNITLTSYVDAMGFGYTACRRSVPHMQRLLRHTGEALEALERAVGA